MKLKELFYKNLHIVLYGVFGVLTTVVNIVVYWVMAHVIRIGTMPSTLIAWICAVLFAYVTNRKWVFHSKAIGKKEILGELISFFACRIATGVLDWVCMFVFVDILHINDIFIKISTNILVIVLNYVASKLVIFKTRKDKQHETV